jgi:hypothetical protein
MNLDISGVPYGQISYVVPSLIKFFEESSKWAKGRASVDDILRFILTGEMHLWVVFDADTNAVHGYVMTEVKRYAQKDMLVIQYCAMTPNVMKHVEDVMHKRAEIFARDLGCKGIEFYGRPGWEPHVKKHGYTVKTVVYEKHFDEVQP